MTISFNGDRDAMTHLNFKLSFILEMYDDFFSIAYHFTTYEIPCSACMHTNEEICCLEEKDAALSQCGTHILPFCLPFLCYRLSWLWSEAAILLHSFTLVKWLSKNEWDHILCKQICCPLYWRNGILILDSGTCCWLWCATHFESRRNAVHKFGLLNSLFHLHAP